MKRKTRNFLTLLGTACMSTCMVLSGVFAMPLTADAEESSVAVTDLVKITSGNATVTANKSVNTKGVKGLAVENDDGYAGELNATFSGDLSLNYIFPGTVSNSGYYKYGDENGAFEFTVEDATNAENYFKIVYEAKNTNAIVYAEYVDEGTTEYRTFNYSTGAMMNNTPVAANGHYGVAVAMFNNATTLTNQLKLTWTDDVLAVKTMSGRQGGVEYTIVEFDGTEAFDATAGDYGLPKLSFANGYKISFKSTYATGTDVCFTKIGDIDLGTATSIAADLAVKEGLYFVNGERVENGDTVTVTKGTDISVSGLSTYTLQGLGTSCGTVTVDGAGTVTDYTGTYNKNVLGTYPLSIGEFTFTVKVVDKMDVSGLISTDNATVTHKKTVNDNGIRGLAVESGHAYEGELNATFSGDLSLNYIFPGTVSNSGYYKYGDENGGFEFTVEDATNAENYFKIVYGVKNTNAIVYAEYVDEGTTEYRTFNYSTGAMMNYTPVAANGYYGVAVAMFNNATTLTNQLKLTWTDDVLAVKTMSGKNGSVECTIVEFDGTEAFDATAGDYGLPKLSFANGYKISFKSTYATGTDVCFIAINDVTLTDYDQITFDEVFSEEVVDKDGNALQSGDTVSIYAGQTLGVRAVNTVDAEEIPRVYAIQYNEFAYTSEDLDLNTVGNYTIASAVNPTFTLNVEVLQGIIVTFDDGNGNLSNVVLGTNEKTYLLAAPTVEGKVFVGWTNNINDNLYYEYAEYTASKSVTFTAMYMDMRMEAGASVRMSDPSGIRFSSRISEADWNAYGDNYIAQMGTIIIPTDLLGTREFTFEGLDGVQILNVPRTTWLSDSTVEKMNFANTDGYKFFASVMTNVHDYNYTRDFAARAYVKIVYSDGSEKYFYTDYEAESNVRSVYEVATKSLAAGETDVNDALKGFVNGVADITITKDGEYAFANANAQSTNVIAGSVVANASGAGEDFTITVTGSNVTNVIVNGVKIYGYDADIVVGESTLTIKDAKIENGENMATITFTTGNTYMANGIDETLKTALTGKTVSIFGDSISTHGTTSVGGNSWYSANTMDLEETWWKQVIDCYGMTLGTNASKGGLGFYKNGNGTSAMVQADVDKLNLATANDLVMLFLGTNDAAAVSNFTGSYAEIVGGERKAVLEAADGLANAANFAEKYYNLLWQICESQCKDDTKAKILIVTPYDTDGAAINAIVDDLAAGFATAYGCDIEVVDLSTSELATSFAGDHALMDAPTSVHPNVYGMDIISDAVVEGLKTLYAE